MAHTELDSTSWVAWPAQRPRIHKIHGAAIPDTSTQAGVSFGDGMVIAMGAVAASIATAERDGASITCQNHRQPPQDWGNGQDVNYLLWVLSRKGFVDQFRSAFGDGLLLLPIIIYYNISCIIFPVMDIVIMM